MTDDGVHFQPIPDDSASGWLALTRITDLCNINLIGTDSTGLSCEKKKRLKEFVQCGLKNFPRIRGGRELACIMI